MKKFLIIICAFFLISCQDSENIIINQNYPSQDFAQIIIHVEGEVNFPGIYKINQNALLYELIALAGGLTKEADQSQINLVMLLQNNQKITIPRKNFSDNNHNILININYASVEELLKIPGIGLSKATNIINYRQSKGFFQSIDDIKKVSGIGEEIYNKIKAYICVS